MLFRSKAFLEISRWLGNTLSLHSWDVVDAIRFVDKKEFSFHKEDITGREEAEFDKYNPQLVFLDAHVYPMTKKIMQICIDRKIDFMCHDVSYQIGVVVAGERSKGFTTGFEKCYAQWELYIMSELFSKKLMEKDTTYYEDDRAKITILKDLYDLAVVEMK